MTSENIIFLTLEEVLTLHQLQLDRFGGADGVRDKGLLESAVAMPQASFGGMYVHGDLYEMAAAYAFHIAENQPFVDGNKRTALASALVFLDFSGIEISDPKESLYMAMISIAEKTLNKSGLAELFKKLAGK